ncbi:hypothetical protein ACLI1A_01975 [Flavobacterium sp. RHBU_3]|uniref:hypothetical protein n=1 Tax=Flavobacterium sp. RHBU_3 TaxID=3391184 RepID=UPI0039846EC2
METSSKIKLANVVTAALINFGIGCLIEAVTSGDKGFRWWFIILWTVLITAAQVFFMKRKKKQENSPSKK